MGNFNFRQRFFTEGDRVPLQRNDIKRLRQTRRRVNNFSPTELPEENIIVLPEKKFELTNNSDFRFAFPFKGQYSVSGEVPSGLSLNRNILSGTPTDNPGTKGQFTIQAQLGLRTFDKTYQWEITD